MIEGWKCPEWIWRYNKLDWFCTAICPFGRNDFGVSCKKDQEKMVLKEGEKKK